jgi:hypothetical protein
VCGSQDGHSQTREQWGSPVVQCPGGLRSASIANITTRFQLDFPGGVVLFSVLQIEPRKVKAYLPEFPRLILAIFQDRSGYGYVTLLQ